MTDEYIDRHFGEIKEHRSDIENRLDDSDCTAKWLKEDNRKVIDGFRNAGEKLILIKDDYEKVITEILIE